jgi:hypothetical protein
MAALAGEAWGVVGSVSEATPPQSTSTIEITDAKIGRSMKNLAIMASAEPRDVGGAAGRARSSRSCRQCPA